MMSYESDDDFSYIGDVEVNSNSEEEGPGDQGPKVNQNGRRVQGKDIVWRDVNVFEDVESYE